MDTFFCVVKNIGYWSKTFKTNMKHSHQQLNSNKQYIRSGYEEDSESYNLQTTIYAKFIASHHIDFIFFLNEDLYK